MHKSIRQAFSFGAALGLSLVVSVSATLAQPTTMTLRKPTPTGSYLAGLAALDDLRPDLAARYFLQAAEAEWDNPVYVGRTFLAYLVGGRVSDAATLAQHVLDLDPADDLARLTLGAVALKQRRYASANQVLSRIPNASLIGITGGIMQGWSQVGAGDLNAALATLDKVGAGGFDEFLVFHRAIMADLGGNRAQAIALAREAYEIDPYVTRIAEAYIRILGNAGRFEDAQAIIDEYDAEGLSHPLIEVLREPISQGRRPGLFAANVQSGAAEMLHGLGTALARDGSVELGVVFLQLALYLDPDAGVVAMTLGELFSGAGRYKEANAIYSSIPASSPLKRSALVRLAENLDLDGNREDAISRLTNLTVTYPDDVEALGVLGDTLRYDEQWEEAAAVYSRLIENIDGDRPRDWRYFYVRGIAYERAGMWAKAEPDFLKALELNPGHPHVLNYLGYSWVDQGIHLDEALEMIERAVATLPRDGYIIDSLGWAFYKLGRIDEAIVELERAVQILPDDPEINDHLGDAYWMAGREREAMFQWRIAIDVDDRGVVTERATPKLIHGLDPEAPTGD